MADRSGGGTMSTDTAGDRIERMLAIVPWIAQQPLGIASIEELCRRFEIDRERLVSLLETVACTGSDPWTLVDVVVDAEEVTVFLPAHLSHPLHLTAEQTFALLTACEALLAAPGASGDSPLRRAHEKLLKAAGPSKVDVVVAPFAAADDIANTIRSAISGSRSVDIEYYSAASDTRRHRRIDPYALVEEHGRWYVQALDHDSAEVRVFRIDRITEATLSDDAFTRPEHIPTFSLFSSDASTPLMSLRVSADAARWVPEHYPCEAIERLTNGDVVLTIGFANRHALERLVLLLGPDLVSIDGDASLVDAGREAAARILANYR